ncbi:MAG TPA: tRNA lysidine(34) synthetase TilS [Lacunisphaera sp.]
MTWPEKAGRMGELIARPAFHPAVLGWAATRRKSEVWSVALSGGSDSVALLLLLWAHWPERRGKLIALHFNHRMRGRESTADEVFCRKLCAGLGVHLETGRWPGRNGGASEAAARTARHEFFAARMKTHRSTVLWLAHQQDDIAETMLMRLARGSGLGGLTAPRPIQTGIDRRTHLRPLLTLKKSELVAALRKAGAEWREDSTNETGLYFRNRVRNKVLPEWAKAAGRDAAAGAARSRGLLEEDDEALKSWAQKLVGTGGGRRDRILDVRTLTGVPRAVTRRVLHQWLLAVAPATDLSRQGFELLLTAVERGEPTKFSLGRKDFALIRKGQMSLKRG